jgi:hypothetical protein
MRLNGCDWTDAIGCGCAIEWMRRCVFIVISGSPRRFRPSSGPPRRFRPSSGPFQCKKRWEQKESKNINEKDPK